MNTKPYARTKTFATFALFWALTGRLAAQGGVGSTANAIGAVSAATNTSSGPRAVALSRQSQLWCASRPTDQTCRLFNVEWSANFNGRRTKPELYYSGLQVTGATTGMMAVEMDVELCVYSATVNPETVFSCPGSSKVRTRVEENNFFHFESFKLEELKRTTPFFLIWIRTGALVRDAFSTPFELKVTSDR